MSNKVIHSTLSSAVTNGSTFTVGYPAGTTMGDFIGGVNHKLVMNQIELDAPDKFGLAFTNNTTITITNRSGGTWAAGSEYQLQLSQPGEEFADRRAKDDQNWVTRPKHCFTSNLVQVHLGTPITADADGYFVSQDLTALGVASSSGTVAAAIAAAALAGTSEVPRNVVAAWTGTAVITITGTDDYGNVIVEKSASGTSLTGVKAFKTVTGIAVSADVTSLTVGTGTTLGLPIFLPGVAMVLREMISATAGAAWTTATAGTLVAGLVNTTGGDLSTAATADTRGTYVPNSAPDGARSWALIIALPDPGYTGAPRAAS